MDSYVSETPTASSTRVNARLVHVPPGTVNTPSLGQIIKINSYKTELSFSTGLKNDVITKNKVVEHRKSSETRQTLSDSTRERVLQIVGKLDIAFDMAKVAQVTGSASLDVYTSKTTHTKQRTFYSWVKTREERVELHDVTRDDFTKVLTDYDHIVTEVIYGKAAGGYLKLTSDEDITNTEAGGRLQAKIASIPIQGSGEINFEFKEELKDYQFDSYFATTGTEDGGLLNPFNFQEKLQNYANSQDTGVIAYVIEPLASFKNLREDALIDEIGAFTRRQIVERTFDLFNFEKATNDTKADPYKYIKDPKEKLEYEKLVFEIHELAIEGLNLISRAIASGNQDQYNDALYDTRYLKTDKYHLSPEGTKLNKYAVLAGKYFLMKPPVTPKPPVLREYNVEFNSKESREFVTDSDFDYVPQYESRTFYIDNTGKCDFLFECDWKDQGHGNKKGQFAVHLVRADTDHIYRKCLFPDFAEHHWTSIAVGEILSDIEKYAKGYKFVVAVKVGWGGHSLTMRNVGFNAKVSFNVHE